MDLSKISIKEYHSFYKTYLEKVNINKSIIEGLKQNLESTVTFYSSIPYQKHNYVYAKGKWTIKAILLHVIDTERIFSYRALRIARQDRTPLVGFEQDDYVAKSFAENRTLESLIQEYRSVRLATISLFNSFNPDALLQIGEVSGSPFSVRVLGYITIGHENHHIQIIKEHYL